MAYPTAKSVVTELQLPWTCSNAVALPTLSSKIHSKINFEDIKHVFTSK